jgi:hypothetical protein
LFDHCPQQNCTANFRTNLHYPVEKLWANLKTTQLATLCAETLDEPIRPARRGVKRGCNDENLIFGCLKATALSL